jgi:hypothetical protein
VVSSGILVHTLWFVKPSGQREKVRKERMKGRWKEVRILSKEIESGK